jgi:hypothetical protein
MVESGSNNVFENGKVARDWGTLGTFLLGEDTHEYQNKCSTLERMLDSLDRVNEHNKELYPDRGDENFGSCCAIRFGGKSSYTDLNSFKNFVKDGCKKAITVEELHQFGVYLEIYCPWWVAEQHGVRKFSYVCYTTQEFLNNMLRATNDLHETGEYPLVRIGGNNAMIDRMIAQRTPKRAKAEIPVGSDTWVIKLTDFESEFVKLTPRRMSYGHNGKRFTSEKAANTMLGKLVVKFPQVKFEVQKKK